MKSHGIYETPGGTILMYAHRELESLVLDKDTILVKDMLALKYAELVYNGMWFTPLHEALDAFVDSTQGPVSGNVRLKLYKGNIIPAGRKSPFSLYREDFATFGQPERSAGIEPGYAPTRLFTLQTGLARSKTGSKEHRLRRTA
jgi:argininosuccinate synthase